MGRIKKITIVLSFLVSGIFAVNCDSAETAYGLEMYSGWHTDTEGQEFGYLGTGIDRIISEHLALTAKVFSSYSYYKYDSDAGTVRAKAPGLKFLIGTKYFNVGEYFIVSGGLDYRDTSLSPDDEDSPVRGAKTGAILEILYNKDLSKMYVAGLMGSYSTIGDSLWGRGQFKYLLPAFSEDITDRKVFIGMEIIGEGNSDYSAFRMGPTIELQKIKQKFSVLLSGGYKHTNSISSSGYFGIDFYYRF